MTVVLVAAILVAGVVALSVLDAVPAIIRARADARLLQASAYTMPEVAAAVATAIRRTDPDLNVELVDRLVDGVLEDLDRGVIGAEHGSPPA